MLSVIIPTWNLTAELAEMTERNIEHIWNVAGVSLEVLVVDNGSPHRRPFRASAMTLWNTNRGIAPAWNEGRRLAHGDVLAFVNSDVRVDPGWDKALFAATVDARRIAFPLTGGKKERAGIGIAGWCFVMSRSTFDLVGSFDETFVPAQYEDTDYFHRAVDAGVQLVSVPAANVVHGDKATTVAAPWADRFAYLHWANRFRYAWKHGVAPDAVPPFWQQPIPDWEVLA